MRKAVAAGIVLALAGPGSYAQVPVTDTVSWTEAVRQDAQRVAEHLEVIRQWGAQYAQLVSMYNHARRVLENPAALADVILDNPALNEALGPEFTDAVAAVNFLQEETAELSRIFSQEDFIGTAEDMVKHVEDRADMLAAKTREMAIKYDGAVRKQEETIWALRQELGNANNAIDQQKILSQITLHQSLLENRKQALHAIQMMQDSERQLIERQRRELQRRYIVGSGKPLPGFGSE